MIDYMDQSLIVASACLVDFVPEPVQEVVVQTNRHAGFPERFRHHRSAFAPREIEFLFHQLRIRILSSRQRQATVRTRANASIPMVTHRCSF